MSHIEECEHVPCTCEEMPPIEFTYGDYNIKYVDGKIFITQKWDDENEMAVSFIEISLNDLQTILKRLG